MPRRGENIYKRKDGRWEGRYVKKRNDKKILYGYVYAKTYKDVKIKLFIAKNAIEKEEHILVSNSESSEIFSSITESWFSSQNSQWKQSSSAKYKNILTVHILPYFGERKISSIQREDVVKFSQILLTKKRGNKEGLSPKTVTNILSVLKNIFKYATQISKLQLADIRTVSIKQSQKPMRVLSHFEQQIITEYLYNNLNYCNLGILICLYTGLRIGEICALKWDDVLFDEQCLFVKKTMQRLQTSDDHKKTAVIISSPKSNCSIRKIPIPNNIFRLLKLYYQKDSYVLTGKIDEYVEPRRMQYYFKNIVKKCNIGSANFHSLRHTFATRCVEIGFEIKSLSEILGHANINITLNRYVHPSMQLKQKNMNMLSDLFTVK